MIEKRDKDVTVKMINIMIDMWEEEAFNLSFTDKTHPSYILVQKIADKNKDIVITTILKRLQKEFTFFAGVLYDILPLSEWPHFPKEVNGKADEVTKIWIEWGYEEGYLKND